jgi:hypothetical protein
MKISLQFISPSPIGTYISVSMALTPAASPSPYKSAILSALATAIVKNSTTPLGNQLSISPSYVTTAVTQDAAPYTCK